MSSPVSYLPPVRILWLYAFLIFKSLYILNIFVNIYVFCIFPVFIADDGNIPKRSILTNMIHTAVLVLKFFINLRLKQVGVIYLNVNYG